MTWTIIALHKILYSIASGNVLILSHPISDLPFLSTRSLAMLLDVSFYLSCPQCVLWVPYSKRPISSLRIPNVNYFFLILRINDHFVLFSPKRSNYSHVPFMVLSTSFCKKCFKSLFFCEETVQHSLSERINIP